MSANIVKKNFLNQSLHKNLRTTFNVEKVRKGAPIILVHKMVFQLWSGAKKIKWESDQM